MNKIIGLWAHPRSLSTAFERMMIQRGDFHVVHEPFNSLYDEGEYKLIAPDGTEVIAFTYDQIIDTIISWSVDHKILIKDTFEYHYDGFFNRIDFLEMIDHSFIVREPEKTINSHYALNSEVTTSEIGYQNLLDFIAYLDDHGFATRAIVDADELLADTPKVVKYYCKNLGITFLPQALSWSNGERKEWKRSKKWHIDAQNSNGFQKSEKIYEKRVDNSEKLKAFYEVCLPQYKKIIALKNQLSMTIL